MTMSLRIVKDAALKSRVYLCCTHRTHRMQAGGSLIIHRNTRLNALNKLKDWWSGGPVEPPPPSDDEVFEDEGGTLVRIDPDGTGGVDGSDMVFGPLAVLVVGFLQEEYDGLKQLLADMGADMVKLVPCTAAMLEGTLQQALEAPAPDYEQPPLGQRRTIVLSGMYGSEVVETVSAYKETGLPPAAFAAAVPNNWRRNLRELLADVHAEHSTMLKMSANLQPKVAEGAWDEDS